MKTRVPGKLSASPVQQPATPAFITAERYRSQMISAFSANQYFLTERGLPSSFPRNLFRKQTTKL